MFTKSLAAACTNIIARNTEKSNIPVLSLERALRHGATTGSVNFISATYILPAVEYGSLANQLMTALPTSAQTKISEKISMARHKTYVIHLTSGSLFCPGSVLAKLKISVFLVVRSDVYRFRRKDEDVASYFLYPSVKCICST